MKCKAYCFLFSSGLSYLGYVLERISLLAKSSETVTKCGLDALIKRSLGIFFSFTALSSTKKNSLWVIPSLFWENCLVVL